MSTSRITLAHGNGGRRMRALIDEVIAPVLDDLLIDPYADACAIDPVTAGSVPVVTTDGYTVRPLEFPGGNIGSLAVHGTVNDLAVSGARPHHLCVGLIIEEGLTIACLERVIAALAKAARREGLRVAAGDTKVVPRGEASGLYITATGIGSRPAALRLGMARIRDGDRILISGPIGDHGVAVMLAREEYGLQGDLRSDSASVLPLTQALLDLPGLRFMRDPTRGGLLTVLHEVQAETRLGVRIEEPALPIRDEVRGVCDILGFDPLTLACEGRVVAVVAADQSETALARWQALTQGRAARDIGAVTGELEGVVMRTALGGERLLPPLEDEPLPRIC